MKPETVLVVLGIDADQKPRAAKFPVADETAVMKAAAAQGFKVGRPKTDEAVELAVRLVDGKIYASGKGLLPLVKEETFKKLVGLLEIEEPKAEVVSAKPAPTGGKPAAVSANGSADPWAKIVTGTTILCEDKSKGGGGWWPCKVTAISKDGKLLTVAWAGFPTLKPFAVKRTGVAILSTKG